MIGGQITQLPIAIGAFHSVLSRLQVIKGEAAAHRTEVAKAEPNRYFLNCTTITLVKMCGTC